MYHYDVEDPEYYGTFNNRLMYYETFETCRVFEDYGHEGGCGTGGDAPVSTTWYYYGQSGNPWYIVTEKEDPGPEEPQYTGTRLKYASNGRAVIFALGISWIKDDPAYNIDWAREFRYDGARQRYMNAMLDPEDLEIGSFNYVSTTWSDYAGDSVYGDFEMIVGVPTETHSFEPGTGEFDWSGGSPAAGSVQFSHGNHISTTRFMTDSTGDRIDSTVYTAFGERIDGTNHRYGYAGAWGYQTHDDLPFLHVGHRYYDPATGRFLQRDPIGIGGGVNVYGYLTGSPVASVDPKGLKESYPWGDKWDKQACDAYCEARGTRIRNKIQVLVRSIGYKRCLENCMKVAADLSQDHDDKYVPEPPWDPWDGPPGDYVNKPDPPPPPAPPAPPAPTPKPKPPVRPTVNPCPVPSGWVCFPAGTVVLTTQGRIPIEALGPDDFVYTYFHATATIAAATIESAGSTGQASVFVDIGIGNEVIRATPHHAFWATNKGWVEAQHLAVGDCLFSDTGQERQITDLARVQLESPIAVYDVKTSNGCFFVGQSSVLAHSMCRFEVR